MNDSLKDGGPAFPQTVSEQNRYTEHYFGMSLRDWFAGQALSGMAGRDHWGPALPERCAQEAYELADAMLKLRQKDIDRRGAISYGP